MNLYVGNLPFKLSEDDLKDVFAKHGQVTSAQIISDRQTGRSRGFGFVEMPNAQEAKTAIEQVKEIGGRQVVINEARPKKERAY